MLKRLIWMVMVLLLAGPAVVTAVEFSADSVMIMAGQESTGKVYFKTKDVSRNELMGMISIIKRPYVYHLFADTQKYSKTNLTEAAKKNPMADVADFKQWMKAQQMQRVGSDRLEGYECDIYAGNVQFDENQDPIAMRIWYAKKLDYPIKTESTMPAPMGKMSAYLKNIIVGKQPASLFEIPKGYTEAASMQEAMGMPAFQMGQDGDLPADGQKVPSKEEMEKMMKQMQEMMKNMQQQKQNG